MKKGYIKDYVPDESSEKGVRYVGKYYITDISAEQRRKGGLLQIIGALIEIILVLTAVSLNCMGNYKVYIVIPMEITLFCILYYITGSYAYLKCDSRMEKLTYEKAFMKTVQSVTIAVIFNIFSLIGEAALIIQNYHNMQGYGDYTFLVMMLIILVINIAAFNRHRKLASQVRQEQTADK